MIAPQIQLPGYLQLGATTARAAACMFVPLSVLTGITPLPRAIGVGITVTSDFIDVRGFNVFWMAAACSGANLSVKVNLVERVSLATMVTRTVLNPLVAGGGLAPIPFGFGNAFALGGNDVFDLISLAFTNVGAAPASLDTFPGMWGTVR